MSIYTKITALYENYAKLETLRQLRNLPERQLEDLGFSMHLINQGVEAWPWREVEDDLQPIQLDALTPLEMSNVANNFAIGTKELAKASGSAKQTQRTAA